MKNLEFDQISGFQNKIKSQVGEIEISENRNQTMKENYVNMKMQK